MKIENCKNIVYNSENYTVMANEIIKGKQEMTLQEARLIRLLVTQVVKQDKDFKTYVIKINDLADFLGIDSSNLYKNIRDLCHQLLKRTVNISTGNPKEPWKTFQWIQLAQYDGNGNLTIMLSNQIQPYLLELNAWFTKYKLKNILAMSSFYAIRLYELFEVTIGVNKNHGIKKYYEFKIDYLREFLGCKYKFKQIVEFKKYVINICIKEINEKSDLLVDLEYIKTGRTITSVRFFVQEKEVQEAIEDNKQEQPLDLPIIDTEDTEPSAEATPDTQISETVKKQAPVKAEPVETDIDMDDLLDNLRAFIKEPLKIKELKEILSISSNNIDVIMNKYAIYQMYDDIKDLKTWLIWAIKTDYKETVKDIDDLCDELRVIITEQLSIKDLKAILSASNNNIKLIASKYSIAKKQGNINNLTAFLIAAIKKDFSEPIEVVANTKKAGFSNYQQRKWDFDMLEKLDEQFLVDKLKEHELEERKKLDAQIMVDKAKEHELEEPEKSETLKELEALEKKFNLRKLKL